MKDGGFDYPSRKDLIALLAYDSISREYNLDSLSSDEIDALATEEASRITRVMRENGPVASVIDSTHVPAVIEMVEEDGDHDGARIRYRSLNRPELGTEMVYTPRYENMIGMRVTEAAKANVGKPVYISKVTKRLRKGQGDRLIHIAFAITPAEPSGRAQQ